MARYLETAAKLREEVNEFVTFIAELEDNLPAIVALGHIINLAVRCNPRQSQGTVRKNIVAKAMEDQPCSVNMTREKDERTGREYNKIHIYTKG